MNQTMKDIKKEIEATETAMNACTPGKDFQKWLELNDKKSRLENDLHRLRVLSKSDEDERRAAFYAGIHKAL